MRREGRGAPGSPRPGPRRGSAAFCLALGFVEPARRVARQMRFQPAVLDGDPTAAWLRHALTFEPVPPDRGDDYVPAVRKDELGVDRVRRYRIGRPGE